MDLHAAFKRCPHLASPAALAVADTQGKFLLPPWLAALNRELVSTWLTPSGRLQVNAPFQHGKSWLSSHYFPAWVLLLWPATRIVLATYSDTFAASFGSKVRDVIQKFGPEHGLDLRRDTKAKDEWRISNRDGGLVCRGVHGGLTGRPCDLLIIDDPIENAEQALSPTILEQHWTWYQTVAFGRLGPTAPVVLVMTRWSKRDLCGRILEEAKRTGEQWRVVKYRAIAGADDPLGRKPGEALWPERVPLSRLQMVERERPRWFKPCWQQEPQEETGVHFHPAQWPRYTDLQSGQADFTSPFNRAWSLSESGSARKVFVRQDCTVIITADWAWSEKQTADYSAIGAYALTPSGHLLVLEIIQRRLRLEELVKEVAALCRAHRPDVCAIEAGHPTLQRECRSYKEIPEVRWLKPGGKGKMARAFPAIVMAENGHVVLPSAPTPWLDSFVTELAGFTGVDDEHDDQVDCLAWAAQTCQSLRAVPRETEGGGPCLLVPGKTNW